LGAAGYATILIGVHHESRSAERCGFAEVMPPGQGAEASERALAKIAELVEQGRPFYLQLGYHEPHRVQGPLADEGESEGGAQYMGFIGDYIAPDDARGVTVPPYLRDDPEARQELAELQGAVHYLDDAIGRLLDGLRRLGLDEQLLVIFTTDHGLALPRAKCSLYDPGLETALLLRWPARGLSGGRTITPLVSNIDLFPTLLELLGIPVSDAGHGHGHIQGRSLRPLLDGETTKHRDCIFAEMTYHDYYHPQRGIRTEQYKLIVNFSTAPSFMDPSQSWHRRTRPVVPEIPAIAYTPLVELYDLAADPLEWHNLAGDLAYATTRRELLGRLDEWMRTTNDPLLGGAVTSPRHHQAVDLLGGTDPSS
jgi:arylsulfatase A-like enzyme